MRAALVQGPRLKDQSETQMAHEEQDKDPGGEQATAAAERKPRVSRAVKLGAAAGIGSAAVAAAVLYMSRTRKPAEKAAPAAPAEDPMD